MKSYKRQKRVITALNINNSYQGERIEQKIQRIVNNKEPISDNAPLVYTERKDGVRPETDIRTDRWELAVQAMDTVTKSVRAKRESKPGTKEIGEKAKEGMKKEDGGTEPVQTTDNKE